MTKAPTEKSLALFLEYAKDAGNWSGTPLVGGNIPSDKSDRGYLTDLKKAGLIKTSVEEGNTWLFFTEAGRALAKEHGIEVEG